MPISRIPISQADTVSVLPVTEFTQFIACLRLRFDTYRTLGYIDHNVGIDLDPFDWSSYHFVAVERSGQIVATVRLIVPITHTSASHGDFSLVQEWCSRIMADERLDIRRSATIPVIETLEENNLPALRLRSHTPAELSRLIVLLEYRGQGIARLLVNAAVEKARQQKLDAIFVECLRCHVPMFEKYGFESMLDLLRYKHLLVPEDVTVLKNEIR